MSLWPLRRPGGAHFEDVPKHIREMVKEIGLTRERLDELNLPELPLYDFVPMLLAEFYYRGQKAEAEVASLTARIGELEERLHTATVCKEIAQEDRSRDFTRAEQAEARVRALTEGMAELETDMRQGGGWSASMWADQLARLRAVHETP